jgi:hypothetical protein
MTVPGCRLTRLSSNLVSAKLDAYRLSGSNFTDPETPHAYIDAA